jgi:hypothetical protein
MFSSSIYQDRAKRNWPTAKHFTGDGRFALVSHVNVNFSRLSAGPGFTVSLFPDLSGLAHERGILTNHNEFLHGGKRTLTAYDLEDGRELNADIEVPYVKRSRPAESLQPAA